MAKPLVVEQKEFEHMLKATSAVSRAPERDKALLLVLYGTALSTSELAAITIADYLAPKGDVKVNSAVREVVSHNGETRPLYWSNKRVVAALDAYLAHRLKAGHGVTVKKGAYRGLDPDSPIFLTEAGQPYTLTKKTLPSGKIAYSCNTLGTLISKLHAHAGIDGGNAQAGRRSWAVRQYRQGRDLVHIAAILGHKSISTTKRLVGGDPVRLADIVAGAV